MALSHFTVELDPPNAPVVRIDALALPTGAVQGVAIEQESPNDLPQLVLYMRAGQITVNGQAIVSDASPASIKDFLAQVDPHALSEAATALQGRPDPRNPGTYLDHPNLAVLRALEAMCDEP